MALEKIKCIFFDLDDVLYDSSGFARKARAAGLSALHDNFPEFDVKEMDADMNAVVRTFSSNYPFIFNEILKRMEVSTENPRHNRAVAEAIKRYHDAKYDAGFAPFHDAKATLLALHKEVEKIGIITNGPSLKQWDKIIRLGLKEFFKPEYVIISDDIGYRKPEPGIYLKAAKHVNADPQRCVHVDDRQEHVEGAIAVGMTGVFCVRGRYAEQIEQAEQDAFSYKISTLSELPGVLLQAEKDVNDLY